jgi:hypothetical protein
MLQRVELWGGVQEEVDEFFDAKSLLGSLQSSCTSFFMSAHESLPGPASSGLAGLAGGSLALYGSPQGGPLLPPWLPPEPTLESSLYQAHDLAASVRQVGRGGMPGRQACVAGHPWL